MNEKNNLALIYHSEISQNLEISGKRLEILVRAKMEYKILAQDLKKKFRKRERKSYFCFIFFYWSTTLRFMRIRSDINDITENTVTI